MGTTASGFIYPDAGYTSGVRQAIQDLADSAEDVIREAGIPRFADSAARDAAITAPVLGMKAVLTSDEITSRYNGTTWKAWESNWITFTPTFVNLTVGSGTLTARYRYRAGMVKVEGTWVYGAGSAVGTAPTMTHPVTATATDGTRFFPLGQSLYLDTGVNAYPGIIHAGSTTTVEFAVINAASTYAVIGAVTAAIPFTFASADVIMWNYEYSPA